MKHFESLANDFLKESMQASFNEEQATSLIKRLAEILTSKYGIVTFEFQQSGLLKALEVYLTKSPS